MENNKRLYYIDFLKSIAAFMVCFYHLNWLDFNFEPQSFYIPNTNKVFLSFCSIGVPLFFIINGSLLMSKDYSLKNNLLRPIRTILIYFFWTLIIGSIIAFCNNDFSLDNLWKVCINYTGYYWFLKTLVILFCLYPIFKWMAKRHKNGLSIIFVLILIFPYIYNLILLFNALVIYLFGFQSNVVLLANRTGFLTLYSILYFLVGYLFLGLENQRSLKTKSIQIVFLFWD